MIDSGEVKNQAELARIKGISRARVTQVMNLLKLPSNILKTTMQLGDPLSKQMVSERYLRRIIKNPKKTKESDIKGYL